MNYLKKQSFVIPIHKTEKQQERICICSLLLGRFSARNRSHNYCSWLEKSSSMPFLHVLFSDNCLITPHTVVNFFGRTARGILCTNSPRGDADNCNRLLPRHTVGPPVWPKLVVRQVARPPSTLPPCVVAEAPLGPCSWGSQQLLGLLSQRPPMQGDVESITQETWSHGKVAMQC